ncbi:hypothetical protein Asppvi_003483 [Aspergillus pseudoviridinutans]|uniref:Uncharacterized protein n=1 Tax=Aspergillus pseudoviridinutans TaxID=1517512 RepID=A0A9P3B746_9EURO|nr:uncharacterized protein Asppvi_003483 [Aspergillus pseudoviridinutans]GIJ84634.1 hypothetical protein Asppvi_003483 [Aspergillus pseudoviridinutans]
MATSKPANVVPGSVGGDSSPDLAHQERGSEISRSINTLAGRGETHLCVDVPEPLCWSDELEDNGFDAWIYSTHEPKLHLSKINTNVLGLVVCAGDCYTYGIHVFQGLTAEFETFVSLVKTRVEGIPHYWQYFPLAPGEAFSNAWVRVRAWRPEEAKAINLGLETTRGRKTLFGSHWNNLYHGSQFRPLVKQHDGLITGIWDNTRDQQPWVTVIGVTCDPSRSHERSAQDMNLEIKQPDYEPPRGYPMNTDLDIWDSWQLTRARAQGIVRITASRSREPEPPRVWGLLLEYEDGGIESLGQFRWDCDTTTSFEGSNVWLKSSFIKTSTGRVGEVLGYVECFTDICGPEGPGPGWQHLQDEWYSLWQSHISFRIWWIGMRGDEWNWD